MKSGKVKFYYADRKLVLSKKQELKTFIESVFKKEKKSLLSISYVFCSDEYLLKINQQHLHHDYYTDVITFDLSGTSSSQKKIEAEVYISIDRVKDNAKQIKATIKKETLRVIFHAALHLCGYNDKKKSEILEMRRKEEQYLNLFYKQI